MIYVLENFFKKMLTSKMAGGILCITGVLM